MGRVTDGESEREGTLPPEWPDLLTNDNGDQRHRRAVHSTVLHLRMDSIATRFA